MSKINMFVYKIKLVYFFRKDLKFKTFNLAMNLYEELKEIFIHSEPQTLPIQDDASPDMPRCIWNDLDAKLRFSKEWLHFELVISSELTWKETIEVYNSKVMSALNNSDLKIDRVGLVVEMIVEDDLEELLDQVVATSSYKEAKEAELSWRNEENIFNICTYIHIDREHSVNNKIKFDINTLHEQKLSEYGKTVDDVLSMCIEILERRMEDVI